MPDKRNSRKASRPTGRIVLEHAADIATMGDRWFLSLASGFGMFGGRAQNVAPSAPKSPPRCPESEIVQSAPSSGARGRRFDVVSANDADAWSPLASGPRVRQESEDDEPCREERPPVGETHRAGVLPLLQALARVVSEHSADEYAGLADDERLWTLIRLLQALGTPNDEARADDELESRKPQQTRQG